MPRRHPFAFTRTTADPADPTTWGVEGCLEVVIRGDGLMVLRLVHGLNDPEVATDLEQALGLVEDPDLFDPDELDLWWAALERWIRG